MALNSRTENYVRALIYNKIFHVWFVCLNAVFVVKRCPKTDTGNIVQEQRLIVVMSQQSDITVCLCLVSSVSCGMSDGHKRNHRGCNIYPFNLYCHQCDFPCSSSLKTRAPRGTDRSPEYNEHFCYKLYSRVMERKTTTLHNTCF